MELKEKLKKDISFLKKCRIFGVDWNNLEIHYDIDQYYIYIPTVDNKHVVIFDELYNVIGIERNSGNINDKVGSRVSLYETPVIDFSYPFVSYSIKNILEVSKLIEINKIDKVTFNDKEVNNDIIKGVLAYLKLLSEEIKDYYIRIYPLIMQGYNIPEVETYIADLMRRVDFNNIEDINYTLRNLGLWYQKKDEYRDLLKLMIEPFKNDLNRPYINELSNSLLDNINKHKELVKK